MTKAVHDPLPPGRLAQHRRYRRVIWTIFGTLVLVVLGVADHCGWLLYPGETMRRVNDRWFRVVEVIDHIRWRLVAEDDDTLETQISLLGVRQPTVSHGAWGEHVLDELCQRVLRRVVILEINPDFAHKGSDLLPALVRFDDGVLANEILLRQGLVVHDPDRVHDRVERFSLLQLQASRDGLGIWARPP